MVKNRLPLTEKENQVLDFILNYIATFGYSPTRKEIGDKFKITPQGGQKFVMALISKGQLKTIQEENKRLSRNIVAVDK